MTYPMADGEPSSPLFLVGHRYTRDDVQRLLNVPRDKRGGNWDTGYTKYESAFFIFCNVGVAGRTGHDYQNRWDDEGLHWYGKNGSRKGQPAIDEMLSGAIPVHVFWREQQREAFAYAGLGKVLASFDRTPVEVRWGFDFLYEQAPAAGVAEPTISSSSSSSSSIDAEVAQLAAAIVERARRSGLIERVTRPTRVAAPIPVTMFVLREKWLERDGRCALCEKKIPIQPNNRLLQLSADRIDSSNPSYGAENLQIAHLGCNLAKNAMSMREWGEFLRMVRS